MDFGEIFRVLRRQWPISVTVLLLTVVATIVTYAKWPVMYQSHAEISLITPQNLAAQASNGGNPYLAVANLSPMADILVTNLSSNQSAEQLQALGVKDSFNAAFTPNVTGPFLTLSLTGPDPRVIQKSMPIIITFAERRLKNLQQTGLVRIPDYALIRSVVIADPSAPDEIKKQKIQVTAAVAIIGLLGTILLSFGAEAIALRRSASPLQKVDEKAKSGDDSERAIPDNAMET